MQDGAGEAAPGARAVAGRFRDDLRQRPVRPYRLRDALSRRGSHRPVAPRTLREVRCPARAPAPGRLHRAAGRDLRRSFVNPFAAWIRARAETQPAPAWNRPVVSVLCITYNQAAFIRQTLDSILGQATDFPFELLVGRRPLHRRDRRDRRRVRRAPSNLVAVLRSGNSARIELRRPHGPRPRRVRGDLRRRRLLDRDPRKLQRQVDFLRARPNSPSASIGCGWSTRTCRGSRSCNPKQCSPQPSLSDLVAHNFVQTNSVLYTLALPRCRGVRVRRGHRPGDWYVT